SAVPSFTPAALELAERIARRYGGSTWDVLRLMAPPRVASVEKRDWTAPAITADQQPEALGSKSTDLDEALLATAGDRVIWEALPDHEPRTSVPALPLVQAALETVATGASAVLVVPDARAVGALLAE